MALSPAQLRSEYQFNPNPSVPFMSREEMMAAMSSPKYAADEGFRSVVEARLAISDRSEWGVSGQSQFINYTFTGHQALPAGQEPEPGANVGPVQGGSW